MLLFQWRNLEAVRIFIRWLASLALTLVILRHHGGLECLELSSMSGGYLVPPLSYIFSSYSSQIKSTILFFKLKLGSGVFKISWLMEYDGFNYMTTLFSAPLTFITTNASCAFTLRVLVWLVRSLDYQTQQKTDTGHKALCCLQTLHITGDISYMDTVFPFPTPPCSVDHHSNFYLIWFSF